MSRWNPTVNGYDYQTLWNFIVDFFEDPAEEDEKKVKELLKWWNEYVFVFFTPLGSNTLIVTFFPVPILLPMTEVQQ
jgi:hypothetical protein